jgi:hypothetical protein
LSDPVASPGERRFPPRAADAGGVQTDGDVTQAQLSAFLERAQEVLMQVPRNPSTYHLPTYLLTYLPTIVLLIRIYY